MLSFDHQTYVRLLKNSSILAKQYRIDCGLDKKEEVIEVTKELPITSENTEVSFTKEELQAKLTKAGINFSHLAGEKSLLKKCLDANLI